MGLPPRRARTVGGRCGRLPNQAALPMIAQVRAVNAECQIATAVRGIPNTGC